jgi:hypothetical protein
LEFDGDTSLVGENEGDEFDGIACKWRKVSKVEGVEEGCRLSVSSLQISKSRLEA